MVTYPFKEWAMGMVDDITKRGTAVGGINAMRRNADNSWTGDIFDGVGLLNGVQAERITGPEAAGFDILITPVGMSPRDGLPAPIGHLASTTTVVPMKSGCPSFPGKRGTR